MLELIRLDHGGDQARVHALLDRTTTTAPEVEARVAEIVAAVRARGDAAVPEYTEAFDHRSPAGGSYEIPAASWAERAAAVDARVMAALARAAERVRAFHVCQLEHGHVIDQGGVRLELRIDALARVGIYVPGGTARYP